jgi:hypothetical protein
VLKPKYHKAKSTEAPLVIVNNTGVEVNTEKSNRVIVCLEQNTGKILNKGS